MYFYYEPVENVFEVSSVHITRNRVDEPLFVRSRTFGEDVQFYDLS